MNWDYFISHAHEDKALVAAPLAHLLNRSGFQVWYDAFCLKIGDSLFESIQKGISGSSHGILVLSKAFIAKKWPKAELAAMFAREDETKGILLPVWHRLTREEVLDFSPILADRVATDTTRGLQRVAEDLVKATHPELLSRLAQAVAERPSDESIHAARSTFRAALEGGGTRDDLRDILTAFPFLLTMLFGYDSWILHGHTLNADPIADFLLLIPHGITGPIEMRFVILGQPNVTGEHRARAAAQLLRRLDECLNSIDQPYQGRPPENWLQRFGASGKGVYLWRTIEPLKRPYNDTGGPCAGDYPWTLQLAESALEYAYDLFGRDFALGEAEYANVHMAHPNTWLLTATIVVGQRSEEYAEHIKTSESIASGVERAARLPVSVTSYQRVLDKRRTW